MLVTALEGSEGNSLILLMRGWRRMEFSCECEDVGENGKEKRTRGEWWYMCWDVSLFVYWRGPSAIALPLADIPFLCSLAAGDPLGPSAGRFSHRGLPSGDFLCVCNMTLSMCAWGPDRDWQRLEDEFWSSGGGCDPRSFLTRGLRSLSDPAYPTRLSRGRPSGGRQGLPSRAAPPGHAHSRI
jgi:hypothetical protein